MVYKASLDKIAKGVTIGVTVLLIFIIVIGSGVLTGKTDLIETITVFVLMLLVFIPVLLYRPKGYEIDPEAIIIKRDVKDLRIEKKDIEFIRPLEREEMRGTIRTFAVGGIFGYFGKYLNSQLGGFIMYATNMNNLILIATKTGKKFVISPDDKNAFLQEAGI
jgi:hypothetical protein